MPLAATAATATRILLRDKKVLPFTDRLLLNWDPLAVVPERQAGQSLWALILKKPWLWWHVIGRWCRQVKNQTRIGIGSIDVAVLAERRGNRFAVGGMDMDVGYSCTVRCAAGLTEHINETLIV